MKFDNVIAELGEFGRYQRRIYFLLCLSFIPHSLQTLGVLFTMAGQDHRCAIPGLPNDTYQVQGAWHEALIHKWIPVHDVDTETGTEPSSLSQSPCQVFSELGGSQEVFNRTQSCQRYVFDTHVFQTSIASEANMICDRKSLPTYANMVFMFGMVVGSVLFGMLSDCIGRKKTLLLCMSCHAAVSLGIAFVSSYLPFVLLRFASALFGIGMILTAFVMGMELVGPKTRRIAGMVIQFFWVVGMLLNVSLAYFIRQWRHLQIVSAIPSFLLILPYAFIIPESPRWLIQKKKFAEASKVIRQAAKVNHVTLSKQVLDCAAVEEEEAPSKANLCQMFSTRSLCVITLVQIYFWHICSLIYYGLTLNVGALSGDIYLNFSMSAVVDLVSNTTCILLLDRVGRKPFLVLSMLTAGVFCLATIFPVLYGGPGHQWITQAFSLVGKYGAANSFVVAFVYTSEVFPTPLRNSGMGLCSFSARSAGILAPILADLGKMMTGKMGVVLPLVIFGGAAVLAGLLALLLPETTNRRLPDSIQEAESYIRMRVPVVDVKDDGKIALSCNEGCSGTERSELMESIS